MILWGLKTAAMFDVWSVEHVLSGISVGSVAARFGRRTTSLLAVLLAAYAWETFEHYLETGLAGSGVQWWFQGVEHWSNRLIADPMMLVLGYFVAMRYPQGVKPARLLSFVWILVHVVAFPHSMYLHQWIP